MKMKFSRFLSGGALILMLSALLSCEESQMANDTLEVEPSSAITFAASDNESVVLSVTTSAEEWRFKAPAWVDASKKGDKLSVNVKDNTSGGTRSGRIEFSAGTAESISVSVVQNEPEEGETVLSVTPSDPIVFQTSGNDDVVLTIETNASEWSYKVPEWITAVKMDNQLKLTASDNDSDMERSGFAEISAEEAKPVHISILQTIGSAAEGNKTPGNLVDNETGEHDVELIVDNKETTATAAFKFILDEAAEENVQVEIFIDENYLNEYNFTHDCKAQLLPATMIAYPTEPVTLEAGVTESAKMDITFDLSSPELSISTSYLVPLCVRTVSDNVSVSSKTKRVNYLLKRKNNREIRNVLYFEVNDVNPLNAIEYMLEDGSMFFDAVILFAANINYKSKQDKVYLHNNPNVQSLLDQTETYLQPLRERGIKVYLGILGNHDPAGLAQLSDWGAQQYAQEVADACLKYKLDGVNLDDEYSQPPILGNHWFAKPSAYAGSRLCYELKKALKNTCPWETEVSVFQWGTLSSLTRVKDLETGEEYLPGQFVDFWCANYGSPTGQAEGMSKKQCAGASIELSRGLGYIDAKRAETIKNEGFGWVMWFSFDPVRNLKTSFMWFNEVAMGEYGMGLKRPTGLYRKRGEGVYDPTRYEDLKLD